MEIWNAEIDDDEEQPLRHFETSNSCAFAPVNNEEFQNVNTEDWEESFVNSMANNESFPTSTTASSCGTSSLTGVSSQGVSPNINLDQPFPFNIPEDQNLSTINDVFEVEKDFMDFVRSFPHNVPTETQHQQQVPAKKSQCDSNAKVGLDHLDNLCKLMEQLGDLKETNVRLRRRIQYLEDIKTLQEIHKEMVGERKLYSSGLSEDEVQQLKNQLQDSQESEASEDSPIRSTLADSLPEEQLLGLYRSKTTNQVNEYKCERGHKSRSSAINKERRERSKSVGHASHLKNKKRPSRWSKVKEVLGIEKTDGLSTNCTDSQNNSEQSSGHSEREKLNSKDSEQSKSYKLSSSKSHTNVLSSRSFSEAERQSGATLIPIKKSGTLDAKTAQAMMECLEKEEIAKKSPKSPWGKMKTMIQIRRDNRHQKSESSSSSPRDAKPTAKVLENSANGHSPTRRSQRGNHRSSFNEADLNSGDGLSQKNHQRLDVGFSGGSDHRYRQKTSPHKHGSSRKSSVHQLETPEGKVKAPSVSPKNRKGNLESYLGGRDGPSPKEASTGKRKKSKTRPPPLDYDPSIPSRDAEDEVDAGMSPSSQRKWMWTRVRDVLKGGRRGEGEEEGVAHQFMSAPSSPASAVEAITFDFDIEKAKATDFPSPRVSDASTVGGGDHSSPSATVTELLRELQQNLSDDFNKKLEEWQRCRAEGGIVGQGGAVQKVAAEVERKDSFGRVRKVSAKPEKKPSTSATKGTYHMLKKDLTWLEKEQQKVDREIIRLSKEKQKFEKRSFRLKQLKEAMTSEDGQKKEVLVKTSAGEFRFEGISDAFTKKLYEWETKKGVNPELSTIALLDESLKPPVEAALSASPSISNSTRASPEPPKACFQVSRASSEPDLSAVLKENGNQTIRSKSGDTLLSGDLEVIASLEPDSTLIVQPESLNAMHHSEDNYYSLLEENMYLLDQLKDKEEICSHLQNELERLDDRTEKTNRNHQEEMEKYRQKLWEIHMSRPRDLQGSLHLISELKSRIEELQKCSDKLKSDRERLEESFRYHSNQQARLADDLIRKIREMQVTYTPIALTRGGSRRKWRKTVKCDPSSVSRIHDLSTQLLQQARDVEQTLMERTRQVCHLRWELLHRDMSAVLLQAALHRVTGDAAPPCILPTWDKRRNRFKNIKAWSVDTTPRRPSEDLVTDDWLQERLRQLSITPYNDWANIDFSPNDLMSTAHELKKETLRLSISKQDRVSDSEEKKSATCSADSEIADSDRYYDTGSAVNSRSSSFSSGPGGLRGSHSDTRLYERSRALRRNSSSSMSCVEASDSSSLHDSDRVHCLVKKFPWRTQWRSLDNVSSSCSSRSSILDDEIGKSHWRPIRSSNRNFEALSQEEQLQNRYGSFKETDEENEEPRTQVTADWGRQCLITPKSVQLARLSTEKNRYSPLPHSSRASDIEYNPRTTMLMQSWEYPGRESLLNEKAPDEYRLSAIESSTAASSSGLYQSATEGSMESLDKYETAIRDEELTISDDPGTKDVYKYEKINSLETFSEFEEDLRQRTSKQIHSNASYGQSPTQNCISDYIDREKHANLELGNQSVPGSPNISKYKYKGTKGFGRPRVEYKKDEDKLPSTSYNLKSSPQLDS
ncbi:hypothetical protein JTE90_025917 [Oedothorax gibbosus]|uniref:Uncharacterized protein n=1 Tax=Oedothorax gibbosus TaxID=931172 RepID=A0AAV6UVB0_9ARAC|nr:hypothetical protein JTE90_025917 [Oedothorax gibbosus]